MNIKATQHSLIFLSYADGGSPNTYALLHEVNGENVLFGQIVDTREGRTFYIDAIEGAAFNDYPAFEAAYFATYPKQKEADHD